MSGKIKIYTKTGDDGTTGLVGGSRVKKFDLRLEAYGTIDELNSVIGVLRSLGIPEDVKTILIAVQNKLFNIGALLASDEKGKSFTASLSVTESNIEMLEKEIDRFERFLPELTSFILPGGDLVSSQCHVARTVCRRAERRVLEFADQSDVQPEIVKYLNRLSDFFFVLSRKLASENGSEQIGWNKDLH